VISPPFHSGLIVGNTEAAMRDLGRAFGLEWSTIKESETAVWTRDGRLDLMFRGGFSKPGPTRLELIEAVPGSPWDGPGDVVLHHVSFWSSDLAADSAELAAKGFPLVATTWVDAEPGRPELFAYHRNGSGPYFELLDEAERPHYEEWWEEGNHQ
jgi:Glyoxalase/Bleomycin resistance protein/Dioxygenase superfamily